MQTSGFRDLHRRMQIFVLLYIEGGSYLEEEDPKWEFVVLYALKECMPDQLIPFWHSYERRKETYSFVGYTSLYRFFYYPDTTRLRLSQCIILPPFQGSGHGAHLYSITYFWILTRPEVSELAGALTAPTARQL
jgi:histone acetyltransferase 1